MLTSDTHRPKPSNSKYSPWIKETIPHQKTTMQAKMWNSNPLLAHHDSNLSHSTMAPRTADYSTDYSAEDEKSLVGSINRADGEAQLEAYTRSRNGRKTNTSNSKHGSLVQIKMQVDKTVLVAGLQSVTGTLDINCATNSKVFKVLL